MKRPRTALLLSGGGRTAINLLEHMEAGSIPAQFACAIASRHDAPGVARLRERGVAVEVVSRRDLPEEEALHRRTEEILLDAGTELVCLCGWLRLFRVRSERVDWTWRAMNIHPALLPAFGGPGMHGRLVHAAVLRSGAKVSGCTVHYVDELYDHGPIILQRTVPVLPDDTVETLAARVFQEELEAYPEAVRMHVEGRVPGRAGGASRI